MGKSGPRCSVCTHPERARIDLALASGVGRDTIAARFNVNAFAVYRHGRNHLSPGQRLALITNSRPIDPHDLPALRAKEGASLLGNLIDQRARLRALADQAAERGDFGAANQAERSVTRNLEVVGRLVGELVNIHEHRNINLLISPDYLRLREALTRALAPYPEAGRAVAQALHAMESETLSPVAPTPPPPAPVKVIEHDWRAPPTPPRPPQC